MLATASLRPARARWHHVLIASVRGHPVVSAPHVVCEPAAPVPALPVLLPHDRLLAVLLACDHFACASPLLLDAGMLAGSCTVAFHLAANAEIWQ